MKYYKTKKVNDKLTAITSLTGEIMYLVEGREKAVLIDTCLGVGQLKRLINEITQKPVMVLLSHGHVDHAMGAPEFETVYINKADIDLYKAHCPLEERMGYIKGTLSNAEELFVEEDWVMPNPHYSFCALEDGMCFDLGGLHVDAYKLPGHTKGSMIFLIREQEILILGDACNNSTFLFTPESLCVEEYYQNIKRVEKRLRGTYRRVFLSHHVMETDVEILTNMQEVCTDILEGRADNIPFQFMGKQALIAKKCNDRFERDDGKSANLIYAPTKFFRTNP